MSIINYRTADLSIACARSALEDIARSGVAGHVVVVDNASGDGSDDAIARWIATEAGDAPVTLLRSPSNTGFSGGHNIGTRHLAAEFYLLLNSDAVLRPGFLAAILAAAGDRPQFGLFAPRIEHEDGEVQVSAFRFASPWSELIRAANSGPVTRLLKRREVAISTDPPEDQIDWASFACILLSGRMMDEIGPMDEGYFLYFEDAEYCLRARRAGWRVAYVPQARAVHHRGGSGPVKTLHKQKKRMPKYLYASRTRYFYQAHGRAGVVLANLMWYLGRAIAQTRRLVGKPVMPAATAEARDIWTNVLDPLGPRMAPHELPEQRS